MGVRGATPEPKQYFFSGDGCFLFGPPLAGNSNLVGFGPVLGVWRLHEFRARAENTKAQFPGARGTSMGNKWFHAFRDGMVFRNFLGKELFFWSDPHRLGIAIQWVFGRFWDFGT